MSTTVDVDIDPPPPGQIAVGCTLTHVAMVFTEPMAQVHMSPEQAIRLGETLMLAASNLIAMRKADEAATEERTIN